MLYALIAAIVCGTVVAVGLIGCLDRQRRAHARREDLMLNQLLHLSGKTWVEPPREAPAADEVADYSQPVRLVASPEQLA